MDAKLNHSDLSAILAKEAGISLAKAELLTKSMFDLIIEGLENDGVVKINGLGTFKLADVASRSSVNVNTGEKFEIKGHRKLTFIPAEALKDSVNQPFAMFEPVEVNDTYKDDESDSEESVAEDIAADETATKHYEREEETIVEQKVEIVHENMKKDFVAEVAESLKEETSKRPEPVLVRVPKKEKREFTVPETKKRNYKWFYVSLSILVVILLSTIYFTLTDSNVNNVVAETSADVLPEKSEVVTATEQPIEAVDTIKEAVATKTIANVLVEEKVEPEVYEFVVTKELAMLDLKDVTLADTIMYEMTGDLAEHIVKSNETLTKIALKYYGDKKLWPYIVKYNSLVRPNDLSKGMRITVPVLRPRD